MLYRKNGKIDTFFLFQNALPNFYPKNLSCMGWSIPQGHDTKNSKPSAGLWFLSLLNLLWINILKPQQKPVKFVR